MIFKAVTVPLKSKLPPRVAFPARRKSRYAIPVARDVIGVARE